MKYYIGIDLGGTNIAAGVVNEDFEIIAKGKVKTACPRPAEEICEDMAKLVLQVATDAGVSMEHVEWVGVGAPGIANRDTGIIEYSNNLGFVNVPVADFISTHVNKKVYIENDANAAAYGEFIAGAAKGANNAVCMTLGTGVGGGIIIDKKIYAGSNCGGAEIGHVVMNIDGPACTCGRKGCIETYCSATALIRMTKEEMAKDTEKRSLLHKIMEEREGTISAKNVYDAMREKDSLATEIVARYERYLAIATTNIINIFQPDVFCLGGGISGEGESLLEPLRKAVAKEVYTRNSPKNSLILPAKLGNDAGIIGAAMLGKMTS